MGMDGSGRLRSDAQAHRAGLIVYGIPGGRKREIWSALAEGFGAEVEAEGRLRPGAVAMYGDPALWPLLYRARAEGRPWVYADNGYFRRGHWDGYFRVTRDAFQHDGVARPGDDGNHGTRWRRLGLAIAPWRSGGRHVLVCPPGEAWARGHGFNAAAWLESTLSRLRHHTDREIVVRFKPQGKRHGMPTLAEALRDCHALVTRESNAAVEALLAGVPVFCTHRCAASAMGCDDLARIETPFTGGDREGWAEVLADNQWTIDEIRAGMMRGRIGL